MSKLIVATLFCLTATICPVMTAGIPPAQRHYSYTYTRSGSAATSQSTGEPTISSSKPSFTATSSPSPSSSYSLVAAAQNSDAPWSVSYSDYSSLPTTSSSAASASYSGVRFQPDGASPGFYCEYPTLTEWQPCNSASSRDCWLQQSKKRHITERCTDCTNDGYGDEINIYTDYENPENAPPGIVREYWIELDGDVTLTADGFEKTTGKVFNNSFPAPVIEACWGDEVVVHLKNNFDKNGSTIHWHGIRQLNTNQMDGVPGVTQCPVAQGDSFTYRWRALQYGHTWYHSHYALQYSDGALGPLVIHGPTSADWDIDVGPVLVQDYVHPTAFIAYENEKTETNFSRANSIVVNGRGHDPATGTGSYSNFKFTPGKKHLIRLINSSAGTHFIFSIDNHRLQVIANDLVAIEPYYTNSLRIGIGQRYTIIVEANQAPSNYWIRTHPATGCNAFVASLGTCPNDPDGTPGVFDDNCVLFDVRTAIASYDVSNVTDTPTTAATALPTSTPFNYSVACLDEPYESLKPVIPWVIDDRPANNITRDRFTIGRQNVGLAASAYEPGGYQHWEFTPEFFWIDYDHPTLLNVSFQEEWDKNYHMIEEPYESGYIFMIFEANALSPNPGDDLTIIPIGHPLHFHGHDVVILAQNTTEFDPDESFATFNFENPPRRDVVLLPADGYIAIAMRADNPGSWLIHCHIAWHSSSGLAMQNLENQQNIVDTIGGPSALDETQRVCNNWKNYDGMHPVMKDESGI